MSLEDHSELKNLLSQSALDLPTDCRYVARDSYTLSHFIIISRRSSESLDTFPLVPNHSFFFFFPSFSDTFSPEILMQYSHSTILFWVNNSKI